MFNSISWSQYFNAIITLLIIYYIVISFKFYKWAILSAFGIEKVDNDSLNTVPLSGLKEFISSETDEINQPKQFKQIDNSSLVQSFTDEVNAYIHGEEIEITKDQFINSLQLICSKYPAIKNADCRNDLIKFLAKEISSKYPNLLQEHDLVSLWD